MDLEKLDDLITKATNASFCCGAFDDYDEDYAVRYDELLTRSIEARENLIEYITQGSAMELLEILNVSMVGRTYLWRANQGTHNTETKVLKVGMDENGDVSVMSTVGEDRVVWNDLSRFLEAIAL